MKSLTSSGYRYNKEIEWASLRLATQNVLLRRSNL